MPRIGDVEDLAAGGAMPETSTASETLPEVGCRATKAVRQMRRTYVLQERRAVDRWRGIAWR